MLGSGSCFCHQGVFAGGAAAAAAASSATTAVAVAAAAAAAAAPGALTAVVASVDEEEEEEGAVGAAEEARALLGEGRGKKEGGESEERVLSFCGRKRKRAVQRQAPQKIDRIASQ